jgi:hypothetical protein
MDEMKKNKTIHSAQDQEKEIVNILIESSLYVDMSIPERQRLLNYLVTSYFDPMLSDNSRTFLNTNRPSPLQ